MTVFAIIAAYLIGSIPCGLILGKLAGVDVRKDGSRNIGATNVSRLLGKKLGLLTLAGDAAKGYLPMLGALYLLEGEGQRLGIALCGGAAFIGHLFPVYLKFRGGKGVATALGIFLFLKPVAVLAAVALFVIVVAIGGYVSLGSMTAAGAMPLLLFFLGAPRLDIVLSLLVAGLIILRHRENISRLIRGEEKSWKKK